jgi:hypothetical protein
MAGESWSASHPFPAKQAGQGQINTESAQAFLADRWNPASRTLLLLRFSVKIEPDSNPGSGDIFAVIFRTRPCASRPHYAIQAETKRDFLLEKQSLNGLPERKS